MEIIYQDEHLFAVDKPAGYFVHPPELSPYPVPKEKICLYHLRKMMKQDVFPVHRLDAPTSGVLLFSMTKAGAREMGHLFMNREIGKTYHAVVRGVVEEAGSINIPLEVDEDGTTAECETLYRRLAMVELPFAVGKKYATTRYSYVEATPTTGRWHQIRRHFDRIAHPLIGDIEHGDTYHNRFFRDQLNLPGLCLRATELRFKHPWTEEPIHIKAPKNERWEQLDSLFKNGWTPKTNV